MPVLVRNNVGGAERRVLQRFGEPTWNNPVVRIVDAKERPLSRRVAGTYTVTGLAAAMVASLEKSGQRAPAWLRLLVVQRRERATFAMHCFWSGEVALGGLPGVVSTRTGWLKGHEVVELVFDPTRIAYADLVRRAQAMSCSQRVYSHTTDQQRTAARLVGDRAVQTNSPIRATPKDDLYTLRRTPLRFVPLTPTQRSRLNAALGRGKKVDRWLSPTQRRLLRAVKAHPRAGWPNTLFAKDFSRSWDRAMKVLNTLSGGGELTPKR